MLDVESIGAVNEDRMRCYRIAAYVFVAFLASAAVSTCHAADEDQRATFANQITQHICSDGGQWLKCYTIRPETCVSVTKSFVQPCVDSVLANVTQIKDEKEGIAISQKLMGCFNERFMAFYGSGKMNTPECAKPPEHLQ